jgi:hypothetical protein
MLLSHAPILEGIGLWSIFPSKRESTLKRELRRAKQEVHAL